MVMQTSTPLVTGPGNLRRSVLLRDISNSPGPSRKRLSNIINQSLTVQEEADDELERSIRRNEAEIQKRLSNISTPRSPQLNVSNEKEIRDHFQICLKMYAENKISAKNAWNLKIIDYMRTVLYSQGLTKDSLQVASTSLDVSTKIYGIRVDDIHAEGLKLASNMARVNTQNADEAEDGRDEDEEAEGNADKENEGPKKKKKRRMFSGQKTTIVKDPKSLLGDVPKLESVFFQTRTNLESSAIDNLFTNKLPKNHARYKFMLLSKEEAWPTYDKKDPKIDYEKTYPIQINPVRSLQICAPFSDFEIDEWDPDQEAQLLKDDSLKPAVEEEVVYDADGIPIPELDGSVHDLFANADAENNYASSEEDEGNGLAQEAVLTNKVAHIVDFRPEENGVCADEYSYSSIASIMSNKLITQVWAGPSHWKLKHVRRTTSRFSGQPEKLTNKPAKKTRIQPALIDFLNEVPKFDRSKLYKARKYRIDECPIKCTLPQVIHTDANLYRSLMLKPVFISTNERKSQQVNNAEEPEVKPYNYENPNDSLYCSQHGMDDGDHGADGDGDGDFQNEEEIAIPQQNFLGENLVNAPELVPKTYIHYALQAKKMDMKKLKVAVWKSLISNKPSELIADEGMYKREVAPKNFSEVYGEVSGRISEKMRQELSCPLAFVALLHLANEQNLHLTGHPDDLKDFTITQLTHFVS